MIGVVVGVWLTARWQRRQWIEDNKRTEYRETFDAINEFRWRLTHYQALYCESPFVDQKAEGQKFQRQEGIMEALSATISTMADRMFIRKAVLDSGIIQEFQNFYHGLEEGKLRASGEAAQALAEMHLKLLQTAWRDLRLGKPFPRIERPRMATEELPIGKKEAAVKQDRTG